MGKAEMWQDKDTHSLCLFSISTKYSWVHFFCPTVNLLLKRKRKYNRASGYLIRSVELIEMQLDHIFVLNWILLKNFGIIGFTLRNQLFFSVLSAFAEQFPFTFHIEIKLVKVGCGKLPNIDTNS